MLVAARGIGEDGGRCPCGGSHGVVVAARCSKKMMRTRELQRCSSGDCNF